MRRVGLSDLDAAVRALLDKPESQWAAIAEQIVADADLADRWRKRRGTLAPRGGNGSLYGAAQGQGPVTGPRWCDAAYCAALGEVLRALGAYRRRDLATKPRQHR